MCSWQSFCPEFLPLAQPLCRGMYNPRRKEPFPVVPTRSPGCPTRVRPMMAVNAAQHKTINVLKTVYFFVIMYHNVFNVCPKTTLPLQCGPGTPQGRPPQGNMTGHRTVQQIQGGQKELTVLENNTIINK